MKRNNHKDKKVTARPARQAIADKKEVLSTWHIVDFKLPGRSGLETLHRLSWRRYILSMIVLISMGLAVYGEKALAETKTSESDVATMVNFDEGNDLLPQTKKAEKVNAKSQPRSAIVKEVSIADEKKPKEKKIEKTVTGNVVFIRKNKMSVEFGEDANGGQELLLSLDKDVKVKHAKNFAQIKQGDLVQVKYEEIYLDPKEKDGEPTVLKMTGKEITFLKSVPAPSDTQAKVSLDKKGL